MPRHPTSWTSILIFSSHLSLCLPCGPFPLGSSQRAGIHTCYMSRPFHCSRLNHLNNIGEYKSQWSNLCSLLHCHGPSSHLGQNNSAPNHIRTTDPDWYNVDFYASRFISETPTIRSSKWSIRRITKADSSHEILREEPRTFEQMRVERFSSETLNTSILLVLSTSVLAVTRFTTLPVGHYPNISN